MNFPNQSKTDQIRSNIYGFCSSKIYFRPNYSHHSSSHDSISYGITQVNHVVVCHMNSNVMERNFKREIFCQIFKKVSKCKNFLKRENLDRWIIPTADWLNNKPKAFCKIFTIPIDWNGIFNWNTIDKWAKLNQIWINFSGSKRVFFLSNGNFVIARILTAYFS